MAKRVLVLVLAMDMEPWRTVENEGQRATWARPDALLPVLWLHGRVKGPIRACIRIISRVLQAFGGGAILSRFRAGAAAWAAGQRVRQRDNMVITGVPETYLMTNAKTVAGFRHILESSEFDYVLRTNSSTYVNLKMLNAFVQDLPETAFYGGTPWTVGNISYATGTSMLLSRDLVERIVSDEDWEFDLVDDLAVGMSMRRAGVVLNAFPRVDVCTPTDLANLSVEDLRSTFIVRCKGTNEREHDVVAMNRVHQLYESAGLL